MAYLDAPRGESRDDADDRLRARAPRSWAARLSATLEAERDRWFLWLPVIYGGGAGAYFSLLEEPSLLVSLAPVAIAMALWAVFRRGTLLVLTTALLLAFTLGFAAAKLRTLWVTAPVLERQLNSVDVRGSAELIEPRPNNSQRITIRVASIRGVTPERLPYRVRIRTQGGHSDVMPGDPIRIRATLSAPAIPALPGDYDFARSAFFQGIGGVGYSLSRPERDTDLGAPPLGLRFEAAVARIRQAISQRVRASLPGESGAIADALITGERGGITAETNAAYRDSGLFHILSISGLHMTIMAGAVFFAIRAALAAIPAIALRYPIKKWAAAAATLAALGYLLISGSAFATVRAWVMISIMFLAVLLDRPAIALRNVAVSALIILLILPDSLLDVGFQMSFAAVVALVAAFEAVRDWRQNRERGSVPGPFLGTAFFFGAIILTTLIASIAVAPFAAYHFHKSQQYAVLANLIAIPVCNIIVMPAALATLVLMPLGLEFLPLWLMGLGIDAMTWVAYGVANLPGAVGRLPAISLSSFLLMALGGLWICIWRRRWRLLGLAAVAAGLMLAPWLRRPDVIVGREGQVLAVRQADGKLAAVAQRGAAFELGRWLEHDGDPRSPRDLSSAQAGFRCDASGCSAIAAGMLVALVRHPSALADDCQRAGLVVMTMPRTAACQTNALVIDLYDLRDRGTHAINIDAGSISVTTVADTRGNRPWTASSSGRNAQRLAADASRPSSFGRGSRLGLFAAPFDLSIDQDRRRPEIEEDDDGDNR